MLLLFFPVSVAASASTSAAAGGCADVCVVGALPPLLSTAPSDHLPLNHSLLMISAVSPRGERPATPPPPLQRSSHPVWLHTTPATAFTACCCFISGRMTLRSGRNHLQAVLRATLIPSSLSYQNDNAFGGLCQNFYLLLQ